MPAGWKYRHSNATYIYKKKVKKENKEKMDSQFCKEHNILNVKNSDTVSSFKIVPHHTVSTESMSTSSLLYELSKL